MKRRRVILRRFGWIFLGVALFCLLVGIALPLWFPWVLRPILRREGITYRAYAHRGYRGCVLTDVRARFGDTEIKAEHVEASLPSRWIGHRFFSGTQREPFVKVINWNVAVLTRPSNSVPSRYFAANLLDDVADAMAQVRRWLPSAVLTNGFVQAAGWHLDFPGTSWNQGVLTTTAKAADVGQALFVKGQFITRRRFDLHAEVRGLEAQIDLAMSRGLTNWDAAGKATWKTNQAKLSGQLGYDSWWPPRAHLTAADWPWPTGEFELAGYRAWNGAIDFSALTNRCSLQLVGTALPQTLNNPQTPPLKLALVLHADEQHITVDKLQLSGGDSLGELTAPTDLKWRGPPLTAPAKFRYQFNLPQLPNLRLAGLVNGTLQIRPRGTNTPSARLDLHGDGVAVSGIPTKSVDLVSRLEWPVLTLEQSRVQLTDGSILTAATSFDVTTRLFTNGHYQYEGATSRQLVPTNFSYSALQLTGQFYGPFTAPLHLGAASIHGLSAPGIKKCDAQLEWRGKALDFEHTTLAVQALAAKLDVGASLHVNLNDGVNVEASIERLDWQHEGHPVYRLEKPCPLALSLPRATNEGSVWNAKLGPMHWSAAGRGLVVNGLVSWPQQGNLQIQSQKLDLAEFGDLIYPPRFRVELDKLNLEAGWSNSPIDLKLQAAARFSGPEQAPLLITANVVANAQGINFNPLTLQDESVGAVSVTGQVPIILLAGGKAPDPTNAAGAHAQGPSLQAGLTASPASAIRLGLNPDAPFNLIASNPPVAHFTRTLGKLGNLALSKPELRLHLRGKVGDLAGTLHLTTDRVGWSPPTNALLVPKVEQLRLDMKIDRERLTLDNLAFLLNGQPVSADGSLPLEHEFWTDLMHGQAATDWKNARVNLSVKDAQLAAFADLLPGKFMTGGRMTVRLALSPGPTVEGQVTVSDAVTKPFPSLGPVRDLNIELKLHDHELAIERLGGTVGSAPLTLTGRLTLKGYSKPELDCTLKGTNVPMAREAGTIIRSDLDLHLASQGDQAPVLSGQITLRDSLFLEDLRLMAPGPEAEPSERPPYFRVTEPPLRDWKLDVKVSGDRFLRVRTPLFTGVVSANFHLQNKLNDPIAVGEASIQSGRITFPFGTLNLDGGSVYLSSETPHRPRLLINASGTCYGYAIKAEISGPADTPKVLFTSTPPLSSGQILLLLTSGQLPPDAGSISQTARAERLALFLGKDVLSRLIGSESAQERLTITSGEHISESGKATYSVEYRLTDHWSVVGEYDQFDSLNAHLKWKIYAK